MTVHNWELVLPESDPPVAWLTKTGRIGINETANKLMENPKYIKVYYDKKKKTVALQPYDSENEYTHRTFKLGRGESRFVNCPMLFSQFGVPEEKTERLTLVVEESNSGNGTGKYIFKLPNASN